jgi:hypothetical protein
LFQQRLDSFVVPSDVCIASFWKRLEILNRGIAGHQVQVHGEQLVPHRNGRRFRGVNSKSDRTGLIRIGRLVLTDGNLSRSAD